ncbi:hypothetical protein [Azospirillum rugosum]|uniref:HepT-like domain-containing protein n=1 Tax=Azospirillum rugosum TaxID=416170 RepID=A0ABS4SGY3_9PROT|nr:hypothetical protein [Azospirillum rugosum]MBP2291825.1 hypothetical protein [Azospirillum rugosum]MDQ0524363.1 hypothetical protein [Azospirillum rugosum]
MHPIFADLDLEWRRVDEEGALLAEAVRRFRDDPAMRSDRVIRWLAVSGIASGVEKAYSGVERMLKMIASTIDGSVPKDEAWHRTLLVRMGVALPAVRPPVLSGGTLSAFDRLRAFRHRERNSYVGDLDEERLLEVADTVPGALAAFRADLDSFRRALEAESSP